MNKKSTPTNPIGLPPSEHFTKALGLIEQLTVSELQSILIQIAFLIRQKAVEELLSMLDSARKENDAKQTDDNQS